MIILPSLEIVPAKYNTSTNTLLSQIPIDGTGDFTVSRTTSPVTGQSTRVNALGLIETVPDNVPRLDYPIGGGCPALLVEPSATNLSKHSENFSNAYWTKNSIAFTSGAATAPDNTTNAFLVYPTGATSNGVVYNYEVVVSGTAYTVSAFVKASGKNWVFIRGVNDNQGVWFNLASGTLGTQQSSTTGRIENYGNGWFRCAVTQTASSINGRVVILVVDGDGSTNVTASGTNGLLYWGAQLEVGSVPTSYIPTVASGITRAADVITDTNASGVIGQTQGTIYCEFEVTNNTANRRVIAISDGGATNRILLLTNNNSYFARIMSTDVTIGALSVGYHKVAIGYQQSGVSGSIFVSVDGGAVVSDTANSFPPSLTHCFLGKSESVTQDAFYLNARIRAAALYPTRLTDTQLALLTSPYTSYSSMASALSYTLG